jgi:hypothetical protein
VCQHDAVLHSLDHVGRRAHAPATAGELLHAAVLYSVRRPRLCLRARTPAAAARHRPMFTPSWFVPLVAERPLARFSSTSITPSPLQTSPSTPPCSVLPPRLVPTPAKIHVQFR